MGAACAPGRRCTCRKNGARSDGGGTRNRPGARGQAAAISLSGRSPRAPQSFSQGQASQPPVAESDKALFGTFKSAPMRSSDGRETITRSDYLFIEEPSAEFATPAYPRLP